MSYNLETKVLKTEVKQLMILKIVVIIKIIILITIDGCGREALKEFKKEML